jgi:predicted nucleotidyltransferase
VIPTNIDGVSVPVASPEDVIVMKVLAGRPKDQEDVRSVLRERQSRLDLDYIRDTLGILEQALDQSDLLPAVELQLRRAN